MSMAAAARLQLGGLARRDVTRRGGRGSRGGLFMAPWRAGADFKAAAVARVAAVARWQAERGAASRSGGGCRDHVLGAIGRRLLRSGAHVRKGKQQRPKAHGSARLAEEKRHRFD